MQPPPPHPRLPPRHLPSQKHHTHHTHQSHRDESCRRGIERPFSCGDVDPDDWGEDDSREEGESRWETLKGRLCFLFAHQL